MVSGYEDFVEQTCKYCFDDIEISNDLRKHFRVL